MKTLVRFGFRELLRMKGRAALIALILAIMATAIGGGLFTQNSLFSTRDHYYDTLHLADLDVQISPASASEMPSLAELRAIPGVREVSRRFVALGYIEQRDGTPLPVVIHHLEPDAHPTVDDVLVQQGSFLTPGDADAALVDRSFADSHELALGGRLVVNPHRFAMHYTIRGVALSPEYLVPTANPDMLIPNKGSLGIIYANRAQLDKLFVDKLYNDLLFTYAPGADEKATKAAVLGALAKLDVERVTPKKANFGYRYVQEMLGARRIFVPVMALILGAMAAIVTFISINRLIVSRRREIGGLLAQGYAPIQFVGGFALLGLAPGVIGALLGLPGAMQFARDLSQKNSELAGLPEPIMRYSGTNVAIAMSAAVLVGLFSALLPAIKVFQLRPAHALRGGDEIRFSGVPGPLERLLSGSIAARYALRNVFRRLRLSLATAVLVGLAIALPAGLLTLTASWETWSKVQTSKLHWDATLSTKVPVKEDLILKVMSTNGVGDYEGFAQGYGTLMREGVEPQEVRVRGLAVPSSFVDLDLKRGRAFSGPDAEEAILNDAFSHGVPAPKVGETISVVFRGKPHTLRVVGVVSDLSMATMFAPIGTTQRIFGNEGKLSGAYLTLGAPTRPRAAYVETLPPEAARPDFAETIEDAEAVAAVPAPKVVEHGTDPQSMKAALFENELVTSVQLKTEMADAMLKYFRAFDHVVAMFVALGGFLAFLFVLSVLGFLLLERENEYATLRSMGYGTKEIAKAVLIEVLTLGSFGFSCSLAAWVVISLALRALLAYAWFHVPMDFRATDIAHVAVPTIAFFVIAAIPGIRGLMRLELATVLRSRAMG